MMMMIQLLGDGLAACCTARLLSSKGFPVAVRKIHRSGATWLLLSRQTETLLRDIFGALALPDSAHRIRRRVVRWGERVATVEVSHQGSVVFEPELLRNLWQRVPLVEAGPEWQAAWTIVSRPNSSLCGQPEGFGSRQAASIMVQLGVDVPEDCCWVESVPDGWLFLLPTGGGNASLIAAGATPRALLDRSQLIAGKLLSFETVAEPEAYFPIFPQILSTLCGADYLACGSAAMRFDPLCGEGAGYAAREALLAAAVISAIENEEPSADVLSHYSTRLMQGFLRHLQACLPFYLTGGDGEFWRRETTELERGIASIASRLGDPAQRRLYRLKGYELERIPEGDAPALTRT